MGIKETLLSYISSFETLTENKIANFAYTWDAYYNNFFEGVSDDAPVNGQNIPIDTAESLQINQQVLNTGFLNTTSSLPRRFINHMFGRTSFNLNKTADLLYNFLVSFHDSLGAPNGVAVLGDDGKIPSENLPNMAGVSSVNGILPDASGNVSISIADIPMSKKWIDKRYGLYYANNWTEIDLGYSSVISSMAISDEGRLVFFDYTKGLMYIEDYKKITHDEITGNIEIFACRGINYSYDSSSQIRLLYNNGVFVAATNFNGVYYSTDGVTFERSTGLPSGTPPLIDYLTCIDGVFYIGNASTVGFGLYKSLDGISWNKEGGLENSMVLGVEKLQDTIICYTPSGAYWQDSLGSWHGLSNIKKLVSYYGSPYYYAISADKLFRGTYPLGNSMELVEDFVNVGNPTDIACSPYFVCVTTDNSNVLITKPYEALISDVKSSLTQGQSYYTYKKILYKRGFWYGFTEKKMFKANTLSQLTSYLLDLTTPSINLGMQQVFYENLLLFVFGYSYKVNINGFEVKDKLKLLTAIGADAVTEVYLPITSAENVFYSNGTWIVYNPNKLFISGYYEFEDAYGSL